VGVCDETSCRRSNAGSFGELGATVKYANALVILVKKHSLATAVYSTDCSHVRRLVRALNIAYNQFWSVLPLVAESGSAKW